MNHTLSVEALNEIEKQVTEKARELELNAHQKAVWRNLLIRELQADLAYAERSSADFTHGKDDGEPPQGARW